MAKKKKNQEENNSVIIEEITASQEIAEIQLERLKMISRERLLTFEETKVYDLLTKNLLLSKGKATDIVGSAKRLPTSTDVQKLIAIAKEVPESVLKNSLTEADSNEDN